MRWYSFSVMLRTIGGELAFGSGADIAPQPCIRWTQRGSDHDAAMRIGGEAPGRRAHSLKRRQEPWLRPGAPPPRIVIDGSSREADERRNCLRLLPRLIRHDAGRRTTPSGTSPVVTKRHSAMSSLRASATIMVLRFLPAATLCSVPLRQGTVLSGRPGSARRAGSCRGAPARCPPWRALSLGGAWPLSSGEPVSPA